MCVCTAQKKTSLREGSDSLAYSVRTTPSRSLPLRAAASRSTCIASSSRPTSWSHIGLSDKAKYDSAANTNGKQEKIRNTLQCPQSAGRITVAMELT